MRYALLFALGISAACSAFAQDGPKTTVLYQTAGSTVGGPTVATAGSGKIFGSPVQGAPYSAAITNESVQTLADGNRIVQTSTGSTARDSQGRTRQDTALPAIGNLSAADPPHIVFILDPVAKVSYMLNLTDKTAQKISMPSAEPGSVSTGGRQVFISQFSTAPVGGAPPMPLPQAIGMKPFAMEDQADVNTEDLGTQTMEGLLVTGTRTKHTIPVGEIGNEKPIIVVTEVWTSPDLKTVVYSKRTDPRMGEQTFKLTNVVCAEPEPALFAVPADFKLMDGPQNVIYRTSH
jgi:hypothetical protein